MSTSLIVREWNDCPITQRVEDQFIDVTAMAKSCNKRWHDYWKTGPAKDYAEALASETNISVSQLVEARKGNSSKFAQGTYAHPDIAMDFARWCEPRFAIQVSRWTRELLATGRVEIEGHPALERGGVTREEFNTLKEMVASLIQVVQTQQTLLLAAPKQRTLDLVDPREWTRRRWPNISDQTVRKIVRRMDTLHKIHLLRPAPQQSPEDNAPLMIERDNLWILDRAYEQFHSKVFPSDYGPLFAKRRQAISNVEAN